MLAPKSLSKKWFKLEAIRNCPERWLKITNNEKNFTFCEVAVWTKNQSNGVRNGGTNFGENKSSNRWKRCPQFYWRNMGPQIKTYSFFVTAEIRLYSREGCWKPTSAYLLKAGNKRWIIKQRENPQSIEATSAVSCLSGPYMWDSRFDIGLLQNVFEHSTCVFRRVS